MPSEPRELTGVPLSNSTKRVQESYSDAKRRCEHNTFFSRSWHYALRKRLDHKGEKLKIKQLDKSGVSGLVTGAAIVVIIIVIIAAILVAYPSLLSGGGGGGSGDWEAGYYAEWNMNYGDAYYVSGQNWTQRWTVEDVNETRVLINVTTLEAWAFGPGDEPVYAYTHAILVKDLFHHAHLRPRAPEFMADPGLGRQREHLHEVGVDRMSTLQRDGRFDI